ncbi:hypothetical protein ZIOFF_035302 [Zingiber officinale]|uniref:Protein FAR1-RELATED SEQUENCE n=1 Tax=Zingiber officinale TaxID=94328 RepID=A0A8J5G943_ZINOF|nr:hypothetical protein ZIOFF_035302 [Zingiber officinale]
MEQELLIEGDVQVLGDSSSSNTLDTPQVGMYFSSEEEVRAFYKSYAQGLGFGISKLGSKKGDDGQIKYFSFGCSKNGKTVPKVKNSFYPRACSKTDCKAKINITVHNDELCVITSIQLEHNYALSPRKSRHFRCNKVLDSQTKRKLELNDQAGITLSKSFQSFVVEAGGYENLSFDERKCINYFVEQYDNALKSKIEKEDNSDFASFNSIIPVISGNPIEKQFQSVYTNKIFKLFQNELRGLMFCNTSFVKEEGSTLFFEVMETVYGKDGTTPKEISFWVQYSELQCQMKCLCRLFEFRGIVCRHLMSVLVKRKVTTVPEHYILERWRKDIKRGYQGITNIYDDSCQHAEERRRYNNLQPLLQEVGQLGSKNDERCFVLIGILKEAKKRFMDTNIGDSLDGDHDSNIIHEESRNESKKFHSPLKVRSRGHPPMKRKQSKLEQIEKRAKPKSRKKGSTIDRKQDELSNIEQIDKFSESQRLFRLDKELLVPNDIIQTMERTRSFEKPIDLLQMHADLFKEGESAKMNFEINDYPGYGDEGFEKLRGVEDELHWWRSFKASLVEDGFRALLGWLCEVRGGARSKGGLTVEVEPGFEFFL